MGLSPGLVKFSEWAPDQTDLNTGVSPQITNVVPQADGYGPFPSFAALSASLPAACRGAFFARNADNTITVFAATSTTLYRLNNTALTWTNSGGPYAAIPVGYNWKFIQFNNFVIAVQQSVVPQVWDLTSSTAFAALGGSPPSAGNITVVNRFVVLSDLTNFPYRVQWSGLNQPTTWDNVTAQSNYQDLADGGHVVGVAGSDNYGLIFQDAAIRNMIYSPGSPVIFEIIKISQDDGALGVNAIVQAGNETYFYSPQGFKLIVPGGQPVQIGRERIDRTFLADMDLGSLGLFMGASDPSHTRVFWSYKSLSGQSGLFNTLLCFDRVLKRWTKISYTGESLASMAKPGATLESLDSVNSSLDALTFSLDEVNSSYTSKLAAFSSTHNLGFFAGAAMEATLETPEQDANGRRVFISGLRPMTDARTPMCSIAARSDVRSSSSYTTETTVGINDVCPQRIDTRYARARLRIPAGDSWTYASGIEPEYRLTGKR